MPLSEQSALDLLRQLLGTRATLRSWCVRTNTYAVASVVADARYVVKLEAPSAPRNRRFEAMATLAHMVRAETTVPVADVVAVDTSRRRWPWNVLIATELVDQTWAELYPRLDEVQRAAAQGQLGQAAAQLHTVTSRDMPRWAPMGALSNHVGHWLRYPNARIVAYERLLTATTSARF
jgi:hypothetical protein